MPSEKVKDLIKRQKQAIKNIKLLGLEYLPSITGPYIYNRSTKRVIISWANGKNKEEFNKFCGV